MKVQRKNLNGATEIFTFGVPVEKFLVKNFSDNDIFVNFETIGDDTTTSIKIPSKIAQTIIYNEYGGGVHENLYVKGTGEVEVQALLW